ncbi:type VII secretion protein [Streptococcus sp. H49]|uniref:type VII secretion protein n=1 Tax=Streptococcus huangxiaojuni TaxID=3237239 RepID=UPI0034A3026C
MKKGLFLVSLILVIASSTSIDANDGNLDIKTDTINQSRQHSTGNAIERRYAPNLFLDRVAQEVTREKTNDENVLSEAANITFNGVSSNNYTFDTMSYTNKLFDNYSVDDTIVTTENEQPKNVVWKISAVVLFMVSMCGIGVWLGRVWHGRRIH